MLCCRRQTRAATKALFKVKTLEMLLNSIDVRDSERVDNEGAEV